MKDETGEQSDKGRRNANGAEPAQPPPRKARTQGPTPRRLAAGLALLNGAPSVAAAGREAGLSVNTTRNATANGLVPARLMRDALEVLPDTIHGLRPLATKRLKGILLDDEESSSVVASTAAVVHKLAAEMPEPEHAEVSDAVLLASSTFGALCAAEHGAALGARFGARAVRAIQLRRQALEALVPEERRRLHPGGAACLRYEPPEGVTKPNQAHTPSPPWTVDERLDRRRT